MSAQPVAFVDTPAAAELRSTVAEFNYHIDAWCFFVAFVTHHRYAPTFGGEFCAVVDADRWPRLVPDPVRSQADPRMASAKRRKRAWNVEHGVDAIRNASREPLVPGTLTLRQVNVLAMRVQGMSTRQICDEMGVTPCRIRQVESRANYGVRSRPGYSDRYRPLFRFAACGGLDALCEMAP